MNGLLKRPGASNDYTTDDTGGSASAGEITFNSGLSLNDKVTVYKVRATSITGFKRSDFTPSASQTVFAFVHTEDTKLQVYKNGVLLREGGSNDYTTSANQDTVTLTSAATSGDLISIITVENTSVQAVTGMMFEEDFVHTDSGLIKFSKIKIDNSDIPQAKSHPDHRPRRESKADRIIVHANWPCNRRPVPRHVPDA